MKRANSFSCVRRSGLLAWLGCAVWLVASAAWAEAPAEAPMELGDGLDAIEEPWAAEERPQETACEVSRDVVPPKIAAARAARARKAAARGGRSAATWPGTWFTGISDDAFLLQWSEAYYGATYDVRVTPVQWLLDFEDSFTPTTGWAQNPDAKASANLSTNVAGDTWVLNYTGAYATNIYYGSKGWLWLDDARAAVTLPLFPDDVEEVRLAYRAGGNSNLDGRKLALLYSLDGGATFTKAMDFPANVYTGILTNSWKPSTPLAMDADVGGIVLCVTNVSTGSGQTVLLEDIAVNPLRPTEQQSNVDGFAMAFAGREPGQAYDVSVRVHSAGDTYEWPDAVRVVPGQFDRASLALTSLTPDTMTVNWSEADGADLEGYILDASSAPFEARTVYAPTNTLDFDTNATWHYEGATVTGTAGSVRTAPVYVYYDSTNYGHFLVGTNGQAIVGGPFEIGGAETATVAFTHGAWNALGTAATTRVEAYWKVDEGEWNLLGAGVAASTGDGGPVAFAENLPAGALDGTNLYVKVVAPNAWRNTYLRGATVHSLRVALSGPGGDFRDAYRLPGFPHEALYTVETITNLAPNTECYVRVQALHGTDRRSAWAHAHARTQSQAITNEPVPVRPSAGLPQATNRQPRGALSGVVVYTSAGHGYCASSGLDTWGLGRGWTNGIVEDYGNIDQANFFAKHLWAAGATVVPFRPLGYQTNEVVLDNTDLVDSAKGVVTFGGQWEASTAVAEYYGKANEVPYLMADADASATTAWACYRPNIPVAGEYPVYAWTRAGLDRINQLYRIFHRGGLTEVRVNHNQVGTGWVWLGNYYFDAGSNGWVNIVNYDPDVADSSNGASAPIAVADAIRFGNGMGSISRGSAGVSGFPRELEASRYWIQAGFGYGMDTSIYDLDGYIDMDDNVGAPRRMAQKMCRTNGWARWRRIYVGLHSNASGGRGAYGLGANGIYSNYPSLYPAQSNLAWTIANQCNVDMTAAASAGIVPSWGKASGGYLKGSYGELSNPYMDATINEVAFHDDLSDAYVMRTLAGRDQLARSTVRGIRRHITSYYRASIPTNDAPDVPTSVSVRRTAADALTVAWSAPAVNGCSGAPATGYIVESSLDGFAFGNPVAVVGNTTSLALTGLSADTPFYFRVMATNAGGVSMPSPVVGACLPADAAESTPVLYVDGFTRADYNCSPGLFVAKVGNYATLVRPRMINSRDYVKEHGAAIHAAGRAFDSVTADRVTAGLLAQYPIVVWGLGEESTVDETFSSAEQTLVSDYLAAGGRLFVSGAELAYDLGSKGSAADQAFLTNVLHVAYARDSGASASASGVSGTIFSNISLTFHTNAHQRLENIRGDIYPADYPDTFTPAAGAVSVATYGGGSYVAGVAWSNATARTVVMGIPFETIDDAARRATVMTRVLDFFSAETPDDPATLDTDGDGIPDAWETQYFGGPTNCVASADSDDDGANNLSEYLAGTDPTDAASVLCLAAVSVPAAADGRVILEWPSAAQRIYAVDAATVLSTNTSWTTILDAVPATPPLNVVTATVPVEADPALFLRIQVRPAE